MKRFLLHIITVLFSIKWTRKGRKPKGVLLVKIDAMGDAILWLDSAKMYRSIYPGQKLTLIYNKVWRDLAINLPYFDEFIELDLKSFQKSFRYKWNFIRKISGQTYEFAINPTFARDFFSNDWILHQVKAKHKIGSVGDYSNTSNSLVRFIKSFDHYTLKLKKRADNWYDELIPVSPVYNWFEMNRNAEFIRGLGIADFQSQISQIPFHLNKNTPIDKPYIVMVLGSGKKERGWPVSGFAELTAFLLKHYDYTILVCGTKAERVYYEELMRLGQFDRSRVLDYCGKTDLVGLMSIIKNAVLLISNDTGTSHIAPAVKTPSVCILGGGHYGRFHPYAPEITTEEDQKYMPKVMVHCMDCFGCLWICKYPLIEGKWRCLAEISPEKVMKETKDILDTTQGNSNKAS